MSTIHRDSVESEWHGPVILARACTTIALPAYTYNNGASGVGATITLNSNAAFPAIDGETLSVGDVFQLGNPAALSDGGPFVVTALGDGSTTPGAAIRDPRCDTALKILNSTIKIRAGISRRGALYQYINHPSITVGVTPLAWGRADSGRIAARNEYAICSSDFDQQVSNVANSASMTGEFPGFATLTTGTVGPIATTSQTERGVFQFTATAASSVATLSFAATPRPFMLDVNQTFKISGRIAGPAAFSDGTNTFRIILGLADAINTAAANGVWIEYTQATSTHWLGTARASGVSTTTGSSGPLVAVTTYTRFEIFHYAGETGLWVSFDGGAPIALASNIPFGVALTFLATLTNSLGSSSRSFTLDSFTFEQFWPFGRAA